jgi:hypothetical protein
LLLCFGEGVLAGPQGEDVSTWQYTGVRTVADVSGDSSRGLGAFEKGVCKEGKDGSTWQMMAAKVAVHTWGATYCWLRDVGLDCGDANKVDRRISASVVC